MYYIYHIPDIKIGCTTEPERRVKRQGYKDYHILEVHSDIDIASKRERELQKEYGYRVDKAPYSHNYQQRVKNSKFAYLGGIKVVKQKLGFHGATKEQRSEWGRLGGFATPPQKGEKNGGSKLTEQDVLNIRKQYTPYCRTYGSTALAQKFGVDTTTIWQIVTRKTWKHL